ncbi:hypothetical protein BVRB_5g113410 [Beta vulgaris subsp. vulgaris]|nr:hypothetical protein BVRB_5g113410 [Beta vulgaris subsp. vulgaris]
MTNDFPYLDVSKLLESSISLYRKIYQQMYHLLPRFPKLTLCN